MVANHSTNGVSESPQRPAVRSRQIGVRLTEPEYSEIEQIAWKSGTTLADWSHDALISNLPGKVSAGLEMHIFTELVGIQLLLMGTLEPLLRGEKMVQDQLNILFRQVQTTKAAKAQELLAKRSQIRQK
jgi:hypothetical protein